MYVEEVMVEAHTEMQTDTLSVRSGASHVHVRSLPGWLRLFLSGLLGKVILLPCDMNNDSS